MPLDKYYTNPTIADKCCKYLNQVLKIDRQKDLIMEPSAGDGAFINGINKLCENTIFIDISPKNIKIQKANFLTYKLQHDSVYNKIYVVGNPPFGFKSSTAIKFIKHSCKFCHSFAFILPLSFANKYMQKSIPLQFHLQGHLTLPEYSFIRHNKPYNVPCVFQVWCKKSSLRKLYQKSKPIGYKFVKQMQNPDIAVRRVGSKAGFVYKNNLQEKNPKTFYFIKLNKASYTKNIKNIVSSTKYNVTGPYSLSKDTIIKKLNKMLF